jgi:hypothetical protein
VIEVDVREIALLMRRAQMRKAAACDAALGPLGTTLSQWHVLRVVRVTGLARRGLVERRQGPGRALRHSLTDAGAELLDRCEQVIGEAMAEYLKALSTTELVVLQGLLERLSEVDQASAPITGTR